MNLQDDNFDHSGLGFIGGASIQVNTEKHPIGAAAMNTYGRAPQWGSKWKAFVRENAGRWVSSYIQANTFPYENTYLDLDPDVKDPLGDPVCRITSGPKENEPKQAIYAGQKMEEWFRAAGAIEVTKAQGGGGPATTACRLRRHENGRQRRQQRCGPLGILARSAQSGNTRRLGVRYGGSAESDTDGAGAGMAHG